MWAVGRIQRTLLLVLARPDRPGSVLMKMRAVIHPLSASNDRSGQFLNHLPGRRLHCLLPVCVAKACELRPFIRKDKAPRIVDDRSQPVRIEGTRDISG